MSDYEPKLKLKGTRLYPAEIHEVNERYKKLIHEYPEIKTERDALLFLIRDNKLIKIPDNKTVDAVIYLIKDSLMCHSICYKKNIFQCFKKTKRSTKYIPLYSGVEETLNHCSMCGGPNNWREDLIAIAKEEGIL